MPNSPQTDNIGELEKIFDELYGKYFPIADNTLEGFREYCRDCLKIKDEFGNIVPFTLNELQEYTLQRIEKQLKETGKIRLNVLKCRQTGISTLIEALIHWENNRKFDQKTVILGHETKASGNLYDIYFRYHSNLPPEIKPIIDSNQHQKRIRYEKLRNEIVVETAGANVDSKNKAGTGRSGTFNYIHATEAAFYPEYQTTFLGLAQASKYAKLIIIETTANGFNDYRNDYFDAKNGKGDYEAVFLSWLEFKSYTKQFKDETERQKLLNTLGADARYNEETGEENKLITEHGATLEQLNWRRWAIDSLCKGNVRDFHQEYPTTDIEAFLATGSPVFNVNTCSINLEKAKKHQSITIGNLIPVYDTANADYKKLIDLGKDDYFTIKDYIKDIRFEPNIKGFVRIQKQLDLDPMDQYRFAGGSDVSEGLAQGDYTCCKILDRKTNEVAITWHGHLNTDLYAEELHKLQLFLKNDIYFAVERNNHGLAVINYAHRLGVIQYFAEVFDKGFTENTELLGFKTHAGTRTQMINDLIAAIRDEEFADNEPGFWEEALTFVRNEQGKMQAQGKDKDPATKCYDDRVFAAIGMWKCHLWMPNYKRLKADDRPNWLKNLQKKQRDEAKQGKGYLAK